MSVRIIIVLLALPLFLLLAAVNSLLLYREETSDMKAGLRGQALAAAVTVAEFAKASPDPFADLTQPHRLRALHTGTKDILGLRSLYLSRPGKPPLNLIDQPLDTVRVGSAPSMPTVIKTWRDPQGRALITALAPAGKGTMVVADIDADPLVRRSVRLEQLSIALVSGSAALAILLGLIIARRVIGEFRRTRAIIDAHGSTSAGQPLGIQEVRDLADAIHLIDASVSSELQRLDATKLGDPAIGIAAIQTRHFPDVSESHGGVQLSIRMLSNAPAGSFHVRNQREDGLTLVLGETDGEPAEALASAIALKTRVLDAPPDAFASRLSSAAAAFGLKTSSEADIRQEAGTMVLGLHGNVTAMNDYAARNPDLDADDLTMDLAILFPTAGIIAAAKPA